MNANEPKTKRGRGRPPGPASQKRFKCVRWYRGLGWSYGDIARRLRVTSQAVQAYCRRHGIVKGGAA